MVKQIDIWKKTMETNIYFLLLQMVIKDDNLPLNKMLQLHVIKVIVRSVVEEDAKYYPQVFPDEFLYEI